MFAQWLFIRFGLLVCSKFGRQMKLHWTGRRNQHHSNIDCHSIMWPCGQVSKFVQVNQVFVQSSSSRMGLTVKGIKVQWKRTFSQCFVRCCRRKCFLWSQTFACFTTNGLQAPQVTMRLVCLILVDQSNQFHCDLGSLETVCWEESNGFVSKDVLHSTKTRDNEAFYFGFSYHSSLGRSCLLSVRASFNQKPLPFWSIGKISINKRRSSFLPESWIHRTSRRITCSITFWPGFPFECVQASILSTVTTIVHLVSLFVEKTRLLVINKWKTIEWDQTDQKCFDWKL